ncbi:ThiF family adenylyltransferase [Kitasatospora sp. NPDC058965]|uniref:ThiF family adenylyltransferase n=1 Tax=Kitasatospora sp. NPDC058965 TaxID=3346682 RepID=UPI00367BA7E7
MLKPALSRAWRDSRTLQFGTDPGRAQVVAEADEPYRAFLALLDGERDAAAVEAAAGRLGLAPPYVRQALAELARNGLLEDSAAVQRALAALPPSRRELLAPDLASLSLLHPPPGAGATVLAARAGARVEVRGAGRVGAAVAAALAAGGVGAVAVLDEGRVRPADCSPAGFGPELLGRSRQGAARELLGRAAGAAAGAGPRAAPVREPAAPVPDLVVLAPRDGSGAFAGPAVAARSLLRAGVPHLYTGVVEHLGVVGPLVLPGASACGGCAALTRAEQDGAWPQLLAQLAADGPGRPPEPACDGALATAVAGLAALQVLLHLDGTRPLSVDGYFEISAADGMARRLRLPPHLDCGCFWR